MTQGQVKASRRRYKTGDLSIRYKAKSPVVYDSRRQKVVERQKAMQSRKANKGGK